MSYQTIEVRKVTPSIGAEISGVDLAGELSNRQVEEIRTAFLENQVIFFRDQTLTPEQHKAFGRHFGKLYIHPEPRFPVPGHPELLTIKADETSKSVAGEVWHSDVSCDPEPPLGSILHMHEIPANGGGDTAFASMYHAYDALSDAMKNFLAGLTAVHDGDRVYRGPKRENKPGKVYPKAEHPVVRTHPDTGRKALFVNRYFTSHIVQLGAEESAGLLDTLYRHLESPVFQCRFKWQVGSLAFWDNRSAQHYAVWDYYPHRRFGYRVTVCGDKPFYRA